MKNKLMRIFVLLMGVVLTSCLDDDKAPLDPTGVKNVIEFLDPSVPSSPAGSIYPAYSNSFLLVPEATYEIKVSYSGPNDNDKDIELQLAIDPVALETYNTHMKYGLYGKEGLHGTTYEMMPEANYEISNFSVTIPAGEKSATFPIKIFPMEFEFGPNYAIPLRIVSTSHGIMSSNFSVAILALGVRNDYDGVYDIVSGNIQRNSATGPDPALSGNYVKDLHMDLLTLSSNTVGIEPVWKDGSGIGGIVGTFLTIDPGTNLVTVASTTNATLKNTPATVNAYDPATRTFTLNFDWGSAPNTRVITGLTLKWSANRP